MKGPVVIRENGVVAAIPIEEFPTDSPRLNDLAADQLLLRLKRALESNSSAGDLEKLAQIFNERFPRRLDDYDRVMHQAIKAVQ